MDADWSSLFHFSLSPFELIARGSAIYWYIFLIFRLVLRRDVGSLAIADILLLVLIADASQNAMTGDYKTVADGMVLIGTLAGWNWLLDVLSFRFKWLERLLQPSPLCLVREGKLQRRNLRRELISDRELISSLREQGVDDITQVRRAYMESDGNISVLKKTEKQ